MRKIKLSIIVLVIFSLIGCSYDNESVYKEVETYIQNNEWQKAINSINKLPSDYKNIDVLKTYVVANIQSLDKSSSNEILISTINQIPNNYSGEFDQDIRDFKNRVENKFLIDTENEFKKLINQKKYSNALVLYDDLVFNKKILSKDNYGVSQYISALESKEKGLEQEWVTYVSAIDDREYRGKILLNEIRVEIKLLDVYLERLFKGKKYNELQTILMRNRNNKKYTSLYNYYAALKEKQDGNNDMYIYYLAQIPSDYSGIMEKEIKSTLKSKHNEILDQQKNNVSYSNYLKSTEVTKTDPEIGMSVKEVKASTWGNPKKINKTTTLNHINEQWVYSDNRYIYFEDGIVTSIQN